MMKQVEESDDGEKVATSGGNQLQENSSTGRLSATNLVQFAIRRQVSWKSVLPLGPSSAFSALHRYSSVEKTLAYALVTWHEYFFFVYRLMRM
jgi:hypothetical protein